MSNDQIESCFETHIAKYDYQGTDDTKLTLAAEDSITVIQKAASGWWFGTVGLRRGWFPSNFVHSIEEHSVSVSASLNSGGLNSAGLNSGGLAASALNIRCETDDGRIYYVNAVTGETAWDESPQVLSPSINQLSIKGDDVASMESGSNRSGRHTHATSNSGLQLAPNWTRIDNPDGQIVYYNSVSGEMQFNIPYAENVVAAIAEQKPKKAPHAGIVRSSAELPPQWSQKTLNDGRIYYFNYVTDESVWSLDSVDSATGELLISIPDIEDEIFIAIESYRQVEFPEGFENWKLLSDKLIDSITTLGNISKERQRLKVTRQSANIVESVRLFLLASRIAQAEPEVRKTIRAVHTKVMATLANSIRAASIACLVWPPPDAFQCLQSSTAELVYTMKEFAQTGLEVNLIISDTDVAEATETGAFATAGGQGPSNNEILHELRVRANHISNQVDKIVSDIQQNAFTDSKVQVLGGIRSITTEVSDFISAVDEYLPASVLPAELNEELKTEKASVFNTVAQLLAAISAATNPFAPSNAISDVAISSTYVTDAMSDLLITIKFAVQEKELLEEGGAAAFVQSPTGDSGYGDSAKLTSDSGSDSGIPSVSFPKRNSSLQARAPIGETADSTARNNVLRLNIPRPGRVKSSESASVSSSGKEKPWYLKYNYDTSEIVIASDGLVKGGTLPALVERMTLHDSNDPVYVQSFLLTYRSFTTSSELFTILRDRYMLTPPAELNETELEDWIKRKRDLIRLRVFNVMKNWIENYCYDDEEDRTVLESLKEFAETKMSEETPTSATQLVTLVERRKELGPNMRIKNAQINPEEVPPPILPWSLKKIKLLDLDPKELARQLTLMESSVYSKIQPVAGWVIATILGEPDVKKRALIVKQYINVAEQCAILNNYCTLNTILGALNSASVHRLKKTWTLVGKPLQQRFKELVSLMSLEKNFSKYRESLRASNPPCIPFFGLYLTDLTFIEDGSADFLRSREKTFNAEEFTIVTPAGQTAEIIREIQQFQNEPYRLKPVNFIQDFVRSGFSEAVDDKELFALSLELEPRDRSVEANISQIHVNGAFLV
ncbi:ras GEF [Rhizoclosmatium globosum]|uniref:Ras GEF n=1 Tax=Rhizoclosmatium globosum TaxID=329046 RepID=A0A1Y2CUT0_9FUNG|nr:ras GEF [Rhizoclosmatium globosum]|eukprot:ORY50820.1 ras GEF [Rhizoclosmatium globosum]